MGTHMDWNSDLVQRCVGIVIGLHIVTYPLIIITCVIFLMS